MPDEPRLLLKVRKCASSTVVLVVYRDQLFSAMGRGFSISVCAFHDG